MPCQRRGARWPNGAARRAVETLVGRDARACRRVPAVKAMILAAGRGERLRPLTDRLPKPLAPIGGEPLLAQQLRWLRRAGIEDAVINLHHLGDRIEARIGDGRGSGVRVRYSREAKLLNTGGGVKAALPLLGEQPFLLLNGDIWTDYPFQRLLRRRPDAAHLVLKPRPSHRPVGDFGLDGELARRQGNATDDLVFCGIAVVHPGIFRNAPEGPFNIARELYFAAANAGRLTGERFDGAWFDIGSPDQLRAARRFAKRTRAER